MAEQEKQGAEGLKSARLSARHSQQLTESPKNDHESLSSFKLCKTPFSTSAVILKGVRNLLEENMKSTSDTGCNNKRGREGITV